MAQPGKYPIEIWKGDNAPAIAWTYPFEIAGDDFLLRLVFKDRELRWRVANGDLELDGPGKRVIWRYAGSDFAGVAARTGTYELTRYAAGGEIRTYVTGPVTLKGIV